MITRETQKEEAVRRMKLLGIDPETVQKFEESGEVSTCSCVTGFPGQTADFVKDKIRELEQQFGFLVYLNVRSETCFGTIDNLLFVGKYEEEWEPMVEDLKDGYALVYAENWTYPQNSEMGSIAFRRTSDGGILRAH